MSLASRGPARALPIPPSMANRRQSERFAAAEDQAWLGWWEGRVYRRSPATLLDISQGGAKVVAEMPPPRCATVWICLDGPHRTEWVEAETVEVTRLADGSARVRLSFREVCPYSFFEVAVYGFAGADEFTSAHSVGVAAAHQAGW